MNVISIFTPYSHDKRANLSHRNIRRTRRVFTNRHWKYEVSGLSELQDKLESLYKETRYSKRKLNRNQLPLILREYSSEINEVYHLFLSLKDIEQIHELDQNVEQLVINRANYVFQEILASIERNEEVISGEYIPAN